MTIRPGGPDRERSAPRRGAKAWVTIELPGQVDGDLPFEVGDLEVEEGARHGDPGVVDEPRECFAAERLADGPRRAADRPCVRHIEQERRHPVAKRLCEALGVLLLPDARKHMPAALGQDLDAAEADASGGAGDHDGLA